VIQHIKYTGIGRKHMGQFKHSLFVFLSKIHDSLIPYQSSIIQIMWLLVVLVGITVGCGNVHDKNDESI
jgi:hypothetical protein